MSTLTPLIRLEKASFGYSRVPVIRDVSLAIRREEFVAIVGPNGAGKSTLFRGLVGLLSPLSGTIDRDSALKHHVGYVPQRDQLDPLYPVTAHEVVAMGLVGVLPWYRFPDQSLTLRISSVLDQVGMRRHAGHVFSDLSGGQRQRVLIARALVIDPLLLVLDEPTSGIDPDAEEIILELLKTLHQNGKTILMVSHRDQALRRYANRVLEVKSGAVTEMA